MAVSILIHATPTSGRLLRAQIAAQYTNVKFDYVPGFEFGKSNKTPEYLAKFPLGKIPCAETPQGPLSESGAIARYVARVRPDAGLMGLSFYQQALVDQWCDFAVTELEAQGPKWLYPVWGYGAFDQKSYDDAKTTTHKYLGYIDAHLVHNTFLTGDTITLGDIFAFTAIRTLFQTVIPESAAPYPSLIRWFNTLLAQKQFAAATTFAWTAEEKYAKGHPNYKEAAPAATTEAKTETKEVKVEAKKVEEKKVEEKKVEEKAAAPVATETAAAAPAEEAKSPEPKKGKGKGKGEAKAEAAPAPKAETPAPKAEAKAEAKTEGKKGKKGSKAVEPEATPAPATPAPTPAPAPAVTVEVKTEEAKTEAKAETPKSGKKGGSAKKPAEEAKKVPESPKAAAKQAPPPASPKAKAEPKAAAKKGKAK